MPSNPSDTAISYAESPFFITDVALKLISRLKAKIIERPIVLEFKREETFGRIKFKDIWKMFTDTVGVWWNLRVRKNYDIGGEINGKQFK